MGLCIANLIILGIARGWIGTGLLGVFREILGGDLRDRIECSLIYGGEKIAAEAYARLNTGVV